MSHWYSACLFAQRASLNRLATHHSRCYYGSRTWFNSRITPIRAVSLLPSFVVLNSSTLSLSLSLSLCIGVLSCLVSWLQGLQTYGEGVCGRVGKSSDVCYSWWVLASMSLCGLPLHDMVDAKGLVKWMLSCQSHKGGFRRSPDAAEPDPFHTFFAIAALSLLAHDVSATHDPMWKELRDYIEEVHPTFAIPKKSFSRAMGDNPQVICT